MKYLILIAYIVFFGILPELIGYDYHIAFIGSLISAIGSSKDAKRLQGRADSINAVRPDYDIPPEAMMYLENAQNMAQGDSPGYSRSIDQAYGTTANTVDASRSIGSGSAMLQAIAQGGVNQNRNFNDINAQNQQFKQNQFGSFQEALMKMSGYKDQQFDTNEMQPYLQKESDKRQFETAAMNQKQASRDSWAAFGDGVVNVGMAALGAPTGEDGISTFAKLFKGKGGGNKDTTPQKPVFNTVPNRPLV